jgi:hypothetical protein
MAAQVDAFSCQVHRLERGLAPNALVAKLRDEVARWQVGALLAPSGWHQSAQRITDTETASAGSFVRALSGAVAPRIRIHGIPKTCQAVLHCSTPF